MGGNSTDKGRIFAVSTAHLINDWYMNYIQTLLPFLLAAGLSISKGAFLISAFTVTSSLIQPVFGILADRKNHRWMVYLGTLWMAVFLCLVGVVESYIFLVFAVSLAGLGNAAFHPQASAMINKASGNRKGFFQAIFMAAGNIGWALTPLLAVPFIQAFGLGLTPLLVLPGVLVALLLWIIVPGDTEGSAGAVVPEGMGTVGETGVADNAVEGTGETAPLLWAEIVKVWRDLVKIMLVISCRSTSFFGLVTLLPVYLLENGVSHLAGSRLLFLMLFSGALGGLIGGFLSDIFGRRYIIAGSLLIAGPMFYLFINSSGVMSYVFLALAGCCLLASFSVTVVATQDILKDNAAMAAGLMLGFGMGVGGMSVGLIGVLAEQKGVDFAVHVLIVLPLLAGMFALRLRKGS